MSDNVKMPVLDLDGIELTEKTTEKSGKTFLEFKGNAVNMGGKLYRVYTSGFGDKAVTKLYPIEAEPAKHVKNGANARMERVEKQLAALIQALTPAPTK